MSILNAHVSVDCVIFGFDFSKLHVLLINRPHVRDKVLDDSIKFALPGDLIYNNENLDTAARRILNELTGLQIIYLKQFGAFGDPARISMERDQKWLNPKLDGLANISIVTVAYFSLVNLHTNEPIVNSIDNDAKWVPVNEIGRLPFDHNLILDKALINLKARLKSRPVGFNLLPTKFTLAQLQRLYELVLNKNLDKRNFRRKILKIGMLNKLDEKQNGVAHKPASYYSFDTNKYEELLKKGFDNFGF